MKKVFLFAAVAFAFAACGQKANTNEATEEAPAVVEEVVVEEAVVADSVAADTVAVAEVAEAPVAE